MSTPAPPPNNPIRVGVFYWLGDHILEAFPSSTDPGGVLLVACDGSYVLRPSHSDGHPVTALWRTVACACGECDGSHPAIAATDFTAGDLTPV